MDNSEINKLIRFLYYLQHQVSLLGSNTSYDVIQLTHNQKHYLSEQLKVEIENKISELERCLTSTNRRRNRDEF